MINEVCANITLTLQQCEITFSRNEAAKIVGSLQRLQRLVDAGRIRAVKPNATAQNGRWRCHAEDVLLYARPKRAKTYWERRNIKPPRPIGL
ncbi:MAG: hypothetical protein IJE18_06350 [Bacteroidaceae bacterium]|nr:hypothetical protein [Bacteroidaceae bacterium]MBQ3196554.1 hypothetical protein [Alistipes sp.]